MSDLPKIYGNCDAGCKWEVPHKSEVVTIDTALSLYGGTQITSGDLNTYITEGNYFITNLSDVINAPIEVGGGQLKVISGSGFKSSIMPNFCHILQLFINYDGRMFIRHYNSVENLWSAWKQFAGEGSHATNADNATALNGLPVNWFRGSNTNFVYKSLNGNGTVDITGITWEYHGFVFNVKGLPEEYVYGFLDVEVADCTGFTPTNENDIIIQTFRDYYTAQTFKRIYRPVDGVWSDWDDKVSCAEYAKEAFSSEEARILDANHWIEIGTLTKGQPVSVTLARGIYIIQFKSNLLRQIDTHLVTVKYGEDGVICFVYTDDAGNETISRITISMNTICLGNSPSAVEQVTEVKLKRIADILV